MAKPMKKPGDCPRGFQNYEVATKSLDCAGPVTSFFAEILFN
jgi:hypothetical protein